MRTRMLRPRTSAVFFKTNTREVETVAALVSHLVRQKIYYEPTLQRE